MFSISVNQVYWRQPIHTNAEWSSNWFQEGRHLSRKLLLWKDLAFNNSIRKFPGEIFNIACSPYISINTNKFLLQFSEYMIYQSRFSQSPVTMQCNILVVSYCSNQVWTFFNSITEILRILISFNKKWVHYLCFSKGNHLFLASQYVKRNMWNATCEKFVMHLSH